MKFVQHKPKEQGESVSEQVCGDVALFWSRKCFKWRFGAKILEVLKGMDTQFDNGRESGKTMLSPTSRYGRMPDRTPKMHVNEGM